MSHAQLSTSKRLLVDGALVRNGNWEPDTAALIIPELNALAVQSLTSLFDEQRGLFGRHAEISVHGLKRKEMVASDSMIALLGLQRLAESGARVGLDTIAIQNAIFSDLGGVQTAGNFGLLAWVMALGQPERLPQLFAEFDFDKMLNACTDGRARNTRGLAWFLSGVAHARAASPRTAADLTDVAAEAYHLLLENQSEYGLFGHSGLRRSIPEIVCKRFGTFEDQMCAIYALTAFARAFEIDEPLESALMCANKVCDLQGAGGQWWFLYDTRRGCVASRYPVCSAHQDGIGPAALLALQEVSNQSFQAAVWHGLSWISENELGTDLRGLDRNLISDAIDRPAISRQWEAACSYLRIPQNAKPKDLRIRHEGHPDHFGWLLYAFGKFGLPKAGTACTIDRCDSHAETVHGSN